MFIEEYHHAFHDSLRSRGWLLTLVYPQYLGMWCLDGCVGNNQGAYFHFQFTQNLVLLLRVASFIISCQIQLLKHLRSSHPNLHFQPESRFDA